MWINQAVAAGWDIRGILCYWRVLLWFCYLLPTYQPTYLLEHMASYLPPPQGRYTFYIIIVGTLGLRCAS
ncbi:hypothetical protein VTJ04DRAFT_3778 [Mycothermus thermophilus]|uniref:uncharacterized protein n=1 Tax=Humicola insolens TaxID=85995 RepID=UPI00374445BD